VSADTRTSTPVAHLDGQLATVGFNPGGLVPVVRQDARTLAEGRMVLSSRSGKQAWCEDDTLSSAVERQGRGACHTGEVLCFHRKSA